MSRRDDQQVKQLQYGVQRMKIQSVDLSNLPFIIQQLTSTERDQVQQALLDLKQLIKGEEQESYLSSILEPKVVQRLVQLSDKSFNEIIYSAAIDILATSSSADQSQSQVLITYNIIDLALQWLWDNDIEIMKSALQIIGNLADSIDNTALIVNKKGVDYLIKLLEQYQKKEDVVVLVIWALSNITRYSNIAEITIPIFRYAINMYLEHWEILWYATESLAQISSKGYIAEILLSGLEIMKSLNYILRHPDRRIMTNTLIILKNIFQVEEIQIDLQLVDQILKQIATLLHERSRQIRLLVFQVLSFIAWGPISQIIIFVQNADVINVLMAKLATEKDIQEKEEILTIFINLIISGSIDTNKNLIQYGIIAYFINSLTLTNVDVVYGSLRALQKILAYDDTLCYGTYQNIAMDQLKDSLQQLVHMENKSIQQIAEELLNNYFNLENQNEEIQN